MTTGGAPMNAAASAASSAARMARATNAASAGLSNAQAIQMQMNQQQQASAAATQLQQRAAAAAQYLNSGGQRKATSRDVQAMLEKNDAALRAWSYLHAQQPPKHLVPEHKAWAHKCLALRQQIGARLEVLASLADKQVAHEDASGKTSSAAPGAAAAPPPAATTAPSASAKKTTTARPKAAPKPTAAKTATTVSMAQAQAQAQALAQQVRQNQAAAARQSASVKQPQAAAAVNFSNHPVPAPTQTAGSANPGVFFNSGSSATASTAASFPASSVTSTSAATTSASAMPNSSSTQAFNPQVYANSAAYMGGMTQQGAQAFMNQQNQANFMTGNAMNMQGMMNPQFMGMQMPGQMPMAMNGGAMYNPNMFASAGYVNMSAANHLPADPFNASFQMQPTASFSVPYGMAGNPQMMGAMGGFVPMQNAQMMMNPMAFNMGMQQFQQSQMQSTGFQNPGQSQQQAQLRQQQLQMQQQQQLQQQQQQQQQQQGSNQAQAPPQAQSLSVSATFSDDDANIFDALGDDAFLNME